MICSNYIAARCSLACLLLLAGASPAAKRVLFVTHSAGFRHESVVTSRQALEALARSTGALEVVATEDLAQISAQNLAAFDVLFFYTSGELALSDRQKQEMLAFVRDGKGFGGAHSATDTLYGWPEYGELIGGVFDGHPWAQDASVDIEDPVHPAMRHLGSSFRIVEEFYQFRSFSRNQVRVLMTLDTRSVDLRVPGVNRADGDFALAWSRNYGRGRVFYTALGHFEDTWRDSRFQALVWNALLWLAGDSPGDAAPRPAAPPAPALARGGVVNAASFQPAPENFVAPGSLISIFGSGLTTGSSLSASSLPLPVKLAGTMVRVNGAPIPLVYVSPSQINAQLPFDLRPADAATLSAGGSAPEPLRLESVSPGIFAVVARPGTASIFATGLGPVAPPVATGAAAPISPLARTMAEPTVTIGGRTARVRFSGLAPLFAGLYQVDADLPPDLPPGPAEVVVEIGGRRSNAATIPIGP